MDNIYTDGTYYSNNPNWGVEDSDYKAKRIANTIKSNDLHFSSVCDVGCGAGEVLLNLSKLFGNSVEFSGYDISPQAYSLSKPREKSNVKFYNGNLLDVKNAFFDLLLAMDVFEHVEDPFSFLRELKLKANYKLFHIPLDLSVRTVLRVTPLLNSREKVGHIHYYTKELAFATLADTGYEIIDWSYSTLVLEKRGLDFRSELLRYCNKLAFKIHNDMAVRLFGGYSMMVLAR